MSAIQRSASNGNRDSMVDGRNHFGFHWIILCGKKQIKHDLHLQVIFWYLVIRPFIWNHLSLVELQHLEHYNITVRAHNQLGQSAKSAFLRVQTKDLPIGKEGLFFFEWPQSILSFTELPLLEYSSLHVSERSIHYRINDSVFTSLKVPLCIRIEVSNYTHTCQRLVTSSGMIKLDKVFLNRVVNTSICLDQYENFCGEVFPVRISKWKFSFKFHQRMKHCEF